ncbi:hypothetical protein AA309_11195 [Microvirga vignae]|uniref:Uncharacterized protein n=1 Tax=Microvirga vignae TaxID=1225564 RepID=A0A0H1RD29_9HYPH|nr:hypothetical protein AA309_11195 [Microvirga vignae]
MVKTWIIECASAGAEALAVPLASQDGRTVLIGMRGMSEMSKSLRASGSGLGAGAASEGEGSRGREERSGSMAEV